MINETNEGWKNWMYEPPSNWKGRDVLPIEIRFEDNPHANYYYDVLPGCSFNYGSKLDKEFKPPNGTAKPERWSTRITRWCDMSAEANVANLQWRPTGIFLELAGEKFFDSLGQMANNNLQGQKGLSPMLSNLLGLGQAVFSGQRSNMYDPWP